MSTPDDHLKDDSRYERPATEPHESLFDAPLLYTPAEAAQRLRVRESWLRKKAAAGQVPRTMLGKHLRSSPADLTAIVAISARAVTGRRARRRPAPTVRDRDLPPPPERSVHPHRHDHR